MNICEFDRFEYLNWKLSNFLKFLFNKYFLWTQTGVTIKKNGFIKKGSAGMQSISAFCLKKNLQFNREGRPPPPR